MKPTFLSKVFQAALMCCLAVILTGCDELFSVLDNPIQTTLSMTTTDVKLTVGDTYQRQATTVSPATIVYASADPAIATVDGNGVVTGVAAGTTTITASVAAVDYWTAASASYKVIVSDGSSSSATPADMKSTPLTFEAAVAGAKVTFTIKVATGVEYSTDGENWSSYTSATPITLAAIGDKVSFRGTNAAYADVFSNYSHISCDKDCYIYGNIMSLIKADGFENETAFTADYTFAMLFMNNAKIKNHTDATKYLVLPATKMTTRCYNRMFNGCVGLTKTPVINVDCDAKERCMYAMFMNCIGLTTVAEGSKISGNMGTNSCSQMFKNCSKLESVPSDLLPAISLATYCYYEMFRNCAKLKKAPKLPAETLKDYCYYCMFKGCTDLNEAWVKADYSVVNNKCMGMFTDAAATGTIHSKTGSNWDTQKVAAGIGGWTVNNDYND